MFTAVAVKNSDEGGGSFLKIEDGQSVTGVFRGNVHKYYQLWPQGGEKKVSDEPFPGAQLRFKANFVVYENKQFVAKIFDFVANTNNSLANLSKVCDVRKTKVMITRNGMGKKTTYTVLPVLNEPITEEQLKKIEAVELNLLNGTPMTAAEEKPPIKNYAPGAKSDEF